MILHEKQTFHCHSLMVGLSGIVAKDFDLSLVLLPLEIIIIKKKIIIIGPHLLRTWLILDVLFIGH